MFSYGPLTMHYGLPTEASELYLVGFCIAFDLNDYGAAWPVKEWI